MPCSLLRCYILIDFKADELAHQDLRQMQMNVNYFDRYDRFEGGNIVYFEDYKYWLGF